MAHRERMSEDELSSLCAQYISLAEEYTQGTVADERSKNTSYYHSDPFGNEVSGRSSFVTSDVLDTIESMMPDFMEIFAGSAQPCEFSPTGPEDEDAAEQATAWCAHVWNVDNDGFMLTYDAIKDALLNKNGFISICPKEDEEVKTTFLENVNSLGLQQLEEDDEVDIVAATEKEVPPDLAQMIPDGILYDVRLERRQPRKRLEITVIPPENMLISPRATGFEEQPMIGAKYEKTVSELLDEGYDEDIVKNAAGFDEQNYDAEVQARFRDDSVVGMGGFPETKLTKKAWVYYLFFHCDWDNDGRAEYRQVVCIGPKKEILSNEAVDDHIFVDFTPIRMPHRVFGVAVADLVRSFQYLRSTVWRQLLDNMYLVNNGRALINERVSMEDWLTNRPGGAVRVRGLQGVGEAYTPIVTAPLGNMAIPLLELINSDKEARTGETRYNQGLDAESLNKTARGMNLVLGQSQRRKLLVARLLAEGFKKAFKKILKFSVAHMDRKRMIRLRGEMVEVDPRSWNADMDVTVTVGLGHGTQQEKVQMAMMRLSLMEKVIQYQGGIDGPFITAPQVHKHLEDVYIASGARSSETYVTKPKGQIKTPKKPSPEEIKAEVEMAKIGVEKEKIALQGQQLQLDAQGMQQEAQEFQAEQEREYFDAGLEHAEHAAEMGQKERESVRKVQTDMAEMAVDARLREREQEQQERQMHTDAMLGAGKLDVDRKKATQPKGPSK